jgi:hypothetical protein
MRFDEVWLIGHKRILGKFLLLRWTRCEDREYGNLVDWRHRRWNLSGKV